MRNVFTVDLEDWFQGLTGTNRRPQAWPQLESRVVAATERLLGLLRGGGVTATFFVLGHVADHHPALVERVAAEGHEIGIHGYWHRFVYKLTPAAFGEEIERSLAAVERITGRAPQGHRAPYFSFTPATPWAYSILASYGLRYDSSVFPTRNMLYGYPHAPRFPYAVETGEGRLWELPASTARVAGVNWPVAGGFYARALPYALLRRAVTSLNRAGRAAILYVHPWELDLGQRYGRVTLRERITHYYGRATLAGKLERLFAEFEFMTAGELVRGLETEHAPAYPVTEPVAGGQIARGVVGKGAGAS